MSLETKTTLILIGLFTWFLGFVKNDWRLSSIGILLLVIINL